MQAFLFFLPILSQFMGGYHPVDFSPGTEAFRLASYTIMMLRDECKQYKQGGCHHLSMIEMLDITTARKQVVNGVNMELKTITTHGIMDINLYYDKIAVKASLATSGLGTMPPIAFNVSAFEKTAPPCVPSEDKCHSFLFFPTCANGITYANPCYALEACRIDLSSGPCESKD